MPGVCQLRDTAEAGVWIYHNKRHLAFFLLDKLLTSILQLLMQFIDFFVLLVRAVRTESLLCISLPPFLAHEQQEAQRAFGWEACQSEVHSL